MGPIDSSKVLPYNELGRAVGLLCCSVIIRGFDSFAVKYKENHPHHATTQHIVIVPPHSLMLLPHEPLSLSLSLSLFFFFDISLSSCDSNYHHQKKLRPKCTNPPPPQTHKLQHHPPLLPLTIFINKNSTSSLACIIIFFLLHIYIYIYIYLFIYLASNTYISCTHFRGGSVMSPYWIDVTHWFESFILQFLFLFFSPPYIISFNPFWPILLKNKSTNLLNNHSSISVQK